MQQPQSAKKLGYIYRHLPGFLIAAPYRLREKHAGETKAIRSPES
jgi:hypothetical protein